ncbi:MAG: helix-turn-helix domain-containing protein [Acetobacteraceae bacterium]|nr:helix-turn-helix domain-containing protein [Acetobacteraceae bacterium]
MRTKAEAGSNVAPPAAPEPFHYTASGLPNVWLLNGFTIEETPYGRGVRIEDADGLHRELARSIVTAKQAIAPAELRFLRKLMGQSQPMLAKWIGISDQTVARWEKGITEIDPAAERLVRLLVLDWLNEEPAVRECLEELADMDEALHGERRLRREGKAWREAA